MNTLTGGGIIFLVVGLALASARSLLGKAAARLAPKGGAHPEMRTPRAYAGWYLAGGLCTAGIGVVVLVVGLASGQPSP